MPSRTEAREFARMAVPKSPPWLAVVLLAALLIAQGAVELGMGRPAICACGQVRLWYGDLFGSGLSQHIADWYSFTHVSHGVLFYALAKLVAPRAPLGARLVGAVVVEAAREMIEN